MRHIVIIVFAAGLAAGCIDQKQDAPAAPTPAPPPAPPPEPARSALPISATAAYTVVGAGSNKCLQFVAGTAEGARAEIRTCDGSKAQLFNLRAVPGGYYEFVSALGNDCLDVPAFSQDDGAGVQQWSCNGGANQHWIIADADGGTVRLVAQHSGKVLAVDGDNTADGSLLGQWAWKSGPNQKFKLQTLPAKAADAKGKGGAGADSGAGGKGGKASKAKKGGKSPPPPTAKP